MFVVWQKFEKKLERDKKELLRHIDSSHGKLDDKISSLEKKAKERFQSRIIQNSTKITNGGII